MYEKNKEIVKKKLDHDKRSRVTKRQYQYFANLDFQNQRESLLPAEFQSLSLCQQ